MQHGQDHTLSSSGSQFRIIVSRDMGKYNVTENEKNEHYFDALSILESQNRKEVMNHGFLYLFPLHHEKCMSHI